MSVLFFKRFLQRPFQIASIIPSSKALVDRVAAKMDFTRARVIAEYGPGEGVHTREIVRRMRRDAQLLLFELDAAFSRDLQRQFADDPRVHVFNGDAATLPEELERRGIRNTAITSFPEFRSAFSRSTRSAPCCRKRTTRSARRQLHHLSGDERTETARHFFRRAESEYFLQNIPPMFITVFQKADTRNGQRAPLSQRRQSACRAHHSA